MLFIKFEQYVRNIFSMFHSSGRLSLFLHRVDPTGWWYMTQGYVSKVNILKYDVLLQSVVSSITHVLYVGQEFQLKE